MRLQHIAITSAVTLLIIGSIHVEEEGSLSLRFDCCFDSLDAFEASLAVEMHPGYVVAGLGKRSGRCVAEAARGTEHQGPSWCRRLCVGHEPLVHGSESQYGMRRAEVSP